MCFEVLNIREVKINLVPELRETSGAKSRYVDRH